MSESLSSQSQPIPQHRKEASATPLKGGKFLLCSSLFRKCSRSPDASSVIKCASLEESAKFARSLSINRENASSGALGDCVVRLRLVGAGSSASRPLPTSPLKSSVVFGHLGRCRRRINPRLLYRSD